MEESQAWYTGGGVGINPLPAGDGRAPGRLCSGVHGGREARLWEKALLPSAARRPAGPHARLGEKALHPSAARRPALEPEAAAGCHQHPQDLPLHDHQNHATPGAEAADSQEALHAHDQEPLAAAQEAAPQELRGRPLEAAASFIPSQWWRIPSGVFSRVRKIAFLGLEFRLAPLLESQLEPFAPPFLEGGADAD